MKFYFSHFFVFLIIIFSANYLYAVPPTVTSGDEPPPTTTYQPPIVSGDAMRMNVLSDTNDSAGFLKDVTHADLIFNKPGDGLPSTKVTISYTKKNCCSPDIVYCPNNNSINVRIKLNLKHTKIKIDEFEADEYSGTYEGMVEGKLHKVFFMSTYCKSAKCIATAGKMVAATLKEMRDGDQFWSAIGLISDF